MIHLLVFVPELCSSWCWVRPKEGVVAEKHLLRGRASVGFRSPSRNLHLKQWQNSMPDISTWNAALASRCSSHCTTAHALLILLLSLVQILPCFLLGTGSWVFPWSSSLIYVSSAISNLWSGQLILPEKHLSSCHGLDARGSSDLRLKTKLPCIGDSPAKVGDAVYIAWFP